MLDRFPDAYEVAMAEQAFDMDESMYLAKAYAKCISPEISESMEIAKGLSLCSRGDSYNVPEKY